MQSEKRVIAEQRSPVHGHAARKPMTRREMRAIWEAEDRQVAHSSQPQPVQRLREAKSEEPSVSSALVVKAVGGDGPSPERMPRRQQLPSGAVFRRGRRSFSRPLKTGRARNITAVAIAMGLSFTAAVPAYAVSPAVAATSNLTQLSPAEIAYREAELVDSGSLQSGALLASSASYSNADGGDFLAAEERATARLTSGNVCQVQAGSVTPSAAGVIPVPAGSYTVTSRIAERWGRMHNGVDLAAPIGTTVVAAWSGTVIEVGSAAGNPMIHLRTVMPDGTQVDHFYLHIPPESVSVSAGQQVTMGQPIAVVGNEGHSTGPHLHFEVHLNGGSNVWPSGPGQIVDGLDMLQAGNAASLPGCKS